MRIIAYNDPRNLDKIKEWNEIKEYPHFCISQTLVQGLSREFGRTEFKVLTTIDKLIKKFYREWSDNPENDVKHFLDIRREISKIKNEKLKKSFMENRMEVYNSIRFLLECSITSDDLYKDDLTEEKVEFIKIYKSIEANLNWAEIKELDSKTVYSFKEAIKEIIIDEIESETVDKRKEIRDETTKVIDEVGKEFHNLIEEDKEKYICNVIESLDKNLLKINSNKDKRKGKLKEISRLKERLENYKGILTCIDEEKIEKVIFHGVHQFTPIIIKLINHLEKNNIEVIFLINYNEKFKRLYSTWENVYRWTECNIEKNDVEYKADSLPLAKNYASIVEGKFQDLVEDNNIVVNKFDNYTEMSNYIAEIYTQAKSKIKGEFNTTKVIGSMREQFYSVDGTNINDMLKVYFPEQFEQKHFLAYPIGQLILGIYNLWNEDKSEIDIQESVIRECLITNIWFEKEDDIVYTPIEIFEMIRVYFSDIEGGNMGDYLERIAELKEKITKIDKMEKENRIDDYKRLGFYKLSVKEVEFFENIIKGINEIITALMGDGKETNMITHYKNLLSLLSNRINASNDENIKKEIKFVNEISERLERIDSSSNESIGAIKETLHFYLVQNKENDSSNWIVRDFNQVDGGVLLADLEAKERMKTDKRSTYHFMEVSDNDMQGKTRTQLSWPLTEGFIGNDNEVLKIINICKKEYKNYLRCTLFYALFYVGQIDVKISYIENKKDNEKEESYYILKLLNLEEKQIESVEDMNFNEKVLDNNTQVMISKDLIRDIDVINYNFCEERFIYESLIEGEGSYSSEFLIKQYLKNFIALSLNKNSNKTKAKDELSKNIKCVIPYAEATLINDIEYAAIIKEEEFGNINPVYERIIKNYIFAKFTEDDVEDRLLEYRRDTKNLNEVLDYLNGGKYKGKKEIKDKCLYCKYRTICTG